MAILFTIFLLLFVDLSVQNLQNHQTGQVVQPTSDVSDRSAQVTYSQPLTYDYTYLTKPYGYSAYRAYDQNYPLQNQNGYGSGYGGATGNGYGGTTGNGYGATGNYYGGTSLWSSVWPLILLPFLIFFGLSFFFPFIVHIPNQWGSRQSSNQPEDEASFIIQSVIQAVESSKCLQKTACDMGLYARHLGSSKSTVLQYVDKFSPQTLSPYIEILKEAANFKGIIKDYCEKYSCEKNSEYSKDPPRSTDRRK